MASWPTRRGVFWNLTKSLFSLLCMFPFLTLEGIHTLNTMYAPVSHSFTASNMGAAELATRLQEHLDAQKEDR